MAASRQLKRLAQTDRQVVEYEYDPGNDIGEYWLHLAEGFVDMIGVRSIHERTVTDVLAELQCVERKTS